MRYTVTWQADEKSKLAQIWIASSNRSSVSAAADRIDSLLAEAPESAGEEFYGDFLISSPPLAVIYKISTEDRVVHIIDVYHQGGVGE